MKLLEIDSTDPYFNMASDQWCLEHLDVRETVLRLWRDSPSVIVGSNQNVHAEVNLRFLEDNGIILARRCTGGGAVYHDLQNLNYSIFGSPEEIGDGKFCVEAVADALRRLGAHAVPSGRNDIVVEGMKVSGFARRNWKNRVLVHGTLMYDVDMDTLSKALDTPFSKLHAKGVASVRSRVANLKDYIPGGIDRFRDSMSALLSDGRVFPLTDRQIDEIRCLSASKFATAGWIYGHSRNAEIIRRATFPCGTVCANISLDGGRITFVDFEGDFIGEKPVIGFSKLLVGAAYGKASLIEILKEAGVGDYFSGMSSEELVSFLLGE